LYNKGRLKQMSNIQCVLHIWAAGTIKAILLGPMAISDIDGVG